MKKNSVPTIKTSKNTEIVDYEVLYHQTKEECSKKDHELKKIRNEKKKNWRDCAVEEKLFSFKSLTQSRS